MPSQHTAAKLRSLNQLSPSRNYFSINLGTKRKLLKISRELSLLRADSSFHEMSHNLLSLIKLSLSLYKSSLALSVCCLIFPMLMRCQTLPSVTYLPLSHDYLVERHKMIPAPHKTRQKKEKKTVPSKPGAKKGISDPDITTWRTHYYYISSPNSI